MRIAVCIKQVPVLSAMQFDPTTKTLKREGVASEVSAFDVRALTKAVETARAEKDAAEERWLALAEMVEG